MNPLLSPEAVLHIYGYKGFIFARGVPRTTALLSKQPVPRPDHPLYVNSSEVDRSSTYMQLVVRLSRYWSPARQKPTAVSTIVTAAVVVPPRSLEKRKRCTRDTQVSCCYCSCHYYPIAAASSRLSLVHFLFVQAAAAPEAPMASLSMVTSTGLSDDGLLHVHAVMLRKELDLFHTTTSNKNKTNNSKDKAINTTNHTQHDA